MKSSSFMRVIIVERTFNVSDPSERITMVEALDQNTDGKDAYASILNGSEHTNVTMKFKSQRNHKINFVVKVYVY